MQRNFSVDLERRNPRTPLARALEKAVARHAMQPKRSAFAVHAAGTRVLLALHGPPERLRVVALCAADARDTVARALASARFALAARGFGTAIAFVEGPECT